MNLSHYPQDQKKMKIIPSHCMLDLLIGCMKMLFSKTIGHHIKFRLISLPKNVGTY
jgi:hypothetical protein